jgi:hypothetical protein
MKTKSTLVMAAVAAILTLSNLQPANAQNRVLGGINVIMDTTLETKDSFALRIITNNLESMRTTPSRYLGINTSVTNTTPYCLEVSHNDGQHRIAKFTNASTTGDRFAMVNTQSGNGVMWRLGVGGSGNNRGIMNGQFYIEKYSGAPYLTSDQAGYTGISDVNPEYRLYVSHPGINFESNYEVYGSALEAHGGGDCNGVYAYSYNPYNIYQGSDRKLRQNIAAKCFLIW